MAKQAAKKKNAANGYELPDPIPKGEVLQDLTKNKWKIGASIGQGGFGEIYEAKQDSATGANYPYVIKIEPHGNGPLFVEINFYIRNAKIEEVEAFKNKKKLNSLGMPVYLGSGSHEHNNKKYRFLVMDKFGKDIGKFFAENKTFSVPTVFKLGIQLLDVLEYIHEHGYVHADIKGANILLGVTKETKDQVYLVDFGLATKYTTENEFKPNPKKAHDGTVEYVSRDAHKGVQTRRGDLEILAYNMVHWLSGTLPWMKNLSNPSTVQSIKEENFSDVPKFLKTCFGEKNVPAALQQFLEYIVSLKFNEKPNYEKVKKIFIKEIKLQGDDINTPLLFKATNLPTKRKVETKKPVSKKIKKDKVENGNDQENENMELPEKIKKNDKSDDTNGNEDENNKDPFEGYTAEMKALAMKKKEKSKIVKNGGSKKNVKDEPVVITNGESPQRNRRNKTRINYTE